MIRWAAFLLMVAPLVAQQEVRPKDVREIAKAGSASIPRLQELLQNPSLDVRLEVVKQITAIGTQRSLDPLIAATRDNDAEMQIRATDGLVNFYRPGYAETGFAASIKRAGTSIKGKFTDTTGQVIDPYVMVRPEVVEALGKLARGGAGMDVRANAARAIGILRGRAAMDDLITAAHSKNTDVIFETLIAIQKIGEPSAAPRIVFLLHDLDPRVQVEAVETTGLLLNREALPDLVDVLNRASDAKVRRAALTSIAMLPAPGSRSLFERYLTDKDERMRAAAAEGLGRLRQPADLPRIEKAYQDEGKPTARLSMAFAEVLLGKTQVAQLSPLQYLIDTLNSAAHKGEAQPLLIELARDSVIRQALYRPLETGTKDEKIGLSGVLARSGDASSIPPLERLTRDSDPEVSKEALRAMRTLQAR
jgi:HEAT repeat protein